MNEKRKREHTQQTLLRMADEFLLQYLLTKHLRKEIICSRLFIMGHCLELYCKSAHALKKPIEHLTKHNVQELLAELDPLLILTFEEQQAGDKLFSQNVNNFELGLYEKHKQALEIYVAINFLKDLKYYIERDGNIIFPVIVSTIPVNMRFIKIINSIREKLPRHSKADSNLRDTIFKIDNSGELLGLFHINKT